MKKAFILFGFSILSLFSSCEYKEVNTDAASYCACKNRQYEVKAAPGECPKLLAKLKEKYEYLPEQYEILANTIAECLAEY
jgi:hypothetical protein